MFSPPLWLHDLCQLVRRALEPARSDPSSASVKVWVKAPVVTPVVASALGLVLVQAPFAEGSANSSQRTGPKPPAKVKQIDKIYHAAQFGPLSRVILSELDLHQGFAFFTFSIS